MATVDPREIGRRIKRARENNGLTQLAFALDANVSPSTVARWESGKLPPVRELMRVADLLAVDADYLVEAEPDVITPSDATVDALEAMREQVQAVLDEVREMRQEVDTRLSALEAPRQAEAAATRSRRA